MRELPRQGPYAAYTLRRAGFRGDKTLEGFDFDFNPTIDHRQIMDLADGRFIVSAYESPSEIF